MKSLLNHAHHMQIQNPAHARPVTLLGGGAVGSVVAEALPKIGVTDLTIWDGDFVGSHNVPMSAYRSPADTIRYPSDVGRYKVDALQDIVAGSSGVSITAHRVMYEGQPLKTSAVISCVDLMGKKDEAPLKGRRLIWSKVKMNPQVEIFCDTRIAGSYIEVFTIEPSRKKDIVRYEALLFNDADGVLQTCGNHGIIYASLMAAAVVVSNLSSFWSTGNKKWRFAMRCDTLEPV